MPNISNIFVRLNTALFLQQTACFHSGPTRAQNQVHDSASDMLLFFFL